jgi:hypothetical protein
MKTPKFFCFPKGEVNYTFERGRKAASMAKPATITIPAEPIGRIPRPVDLIETPEEVWDRSFETGKNWRRCWEDGWFFD